MQAKLAGQFGTRFWPALEGECSWQTTALGVARTTVTQSFGTPTRSDMPQDASVAVNRPWQHHASRHHQANASVTSLVLVAVSKELLIDLMPSEERIPRQQLTRRMRPQRSQRRSQRLSRTMEALLRKSPRQNGRSANRRLSQRPSRRRNLMKISVWMTTKVSHSSESLTLVAGGRVSPCVIWPRN